MRNTVHPTIRTVAVALALAALFTAFGVRADTLDNAEAKRRGVPVEAIQLERANQKVADLQKQVDGLKKRADDLQDQLTLSQSQAKESAALADKLKQELQAAKSQIPGNGPVTASDGLAKIDAGDVSVVFLSAAISPVSVSSVMGDPTDTEETYLVVKIRVYNRSTDKKFNYRTLRGSDFGIGESAAQAKDDIGNAYKRVGFGGMHKIAGAVENSESVYPGKAVDDVLVFEKPVGAAKSIVLNVPLSIFERTGTVKVTIPCPK